MRLRDLLEGLVEITGKDLHRANEIEISGLTLDSRTLKGNEAFVALAGTKQHGLSFIDKAISRGASAVLYDPSGDGVQLAAGIRGIDLFPVECLESVLADLAVRFYGDPSRQLKVIGITGTNGKTSCSQFLGQVIDDTGIIGTLGWGEWGRLNKTMNTTPDVLSVHRILAEFVQTNKKSVAMEVSSHGLEQGRVNKVAFTGAVYTNISRDHLDYHGTMEAYLAAKLKLLQVPGLEFAVVNLDDESCHQIIAAAPAPLMLWGVSAKGRRLLSGENVNAQRIVHTLEGIEVEVEWRGQIQTIKAPLYGDFNVENILCVIAVMLAMGGSLDEAAAKLEFVKPVAGRMERCATKALSLNVFVDYAHTPDALDRVLATLRKHCDKELWVVFGCGGDRDAGKRPQMGAIAEKWADRVIVTDDNPRFEDNSLIVKQILAGCRSNKVELIQDRQQAILHAITSAADKDCIIIAGKGHENYQEIKGIQYPFDDKEIAEEALYNRFGMQ